MSEIGRLERLILERYDMASKFGSLHPIVRELIEYIYAELSDEEFEKAAYYITLTITRTLAYCTNSDKLEFSKARVYSNWNTYTSSGCIRTGIHVTIIMDWKEIDLMLPNFYGAMQDRDKFNTALEMMLWANMFLHPITIDTSDTNYIYEHISGGLDVFLERLAYDIRHGLTDIPLKGFIRLHKDKIPYILETCKKHEWNDLTMAILRVVEESGMREQLLEREFRL